ncbi:hypothetical protein IW140_005266 [Coemansia sp. RSA 1813]|nr:hypothetical protein EV178_004267 [Coemansia sp. RSA 1646]KAJ1770839.1 hypothetical protein LPJ74_002825 [Coemansia sp. RSA 1843]KAJ2087111.1 hypothetical protein IW138_005209 [Coemansia sp. RSA 986]KAJ2211744.1 hypothetical protein EV179_005245 [Coemansia sp. RSA 487]KAJ2565630.1 hypothetical protein IW140_005266 [Coemansia sp. RSA 1813]
MSPVFQDLKGIDNIYCPSKSCSREQDWLVYEPTQAALWALGGVMLFFGFFSVTFGDRGKVVFYGKADIRSAATFLAISMFLRAGLTHEKGDKTAMYIASMIFNYFSGVALSNILIANSFLLWNRLEEPSGMAQVCSMFTRFVMFCVEFSLTVAGVYLMFHPYNEGSAGLGIRCLQAELGILLVLVACTAIAFFACIWFVSYISVGNLVSTVTTLCLALLWNGYMFARTFVDLDNKARDSEKMFILLNYLPLMLGFLLILFLDEPLRARA